MTSSQQAKEELAAKQAKDRPDYLDSIDGQLKNSIADSRKLYWTNYWIYIIFVVVGLVLIGFSVAESIAQGASAGAVTYAVLGIADFVMLFLFNLQKRLRTLLGDVGQIELIHNTWNIQNRMIDNAAYDPNTKAYRTTDFDKMKIYINEYAKIGEEALSAIENYVGNDSTTHD